MTRSKTKKATPRNRSVTARQAKDMFVEADSTYFLKLVLVVILGTIWLKFATPMSWNGIPVGGIPVGLIIGLAGIRLLEKNAVDRKIWYAVLIVTAVVSNLLPAGFVI